MEFRISTLCPTDNASGSRGADSWKGAEDHGKIDPLSEAMGSLLFFLYFVLGDIEIILWNFTEIMFYFFFFAGIVSWRISTKMVG